MQADASVVRRLYEARARGDLEGAASFLAWDVEWHEPYEYLGSLKGRDAVMTAIRQSMAQTHGTFRLDLHDVLASDEHVVALVRIAAGRHGQRKTGKVVGIFHVRDGLIQEVWFATDEDVEAVSEFMRGEPTS
jgi:ketosteroid isomerase-like protein